YNKFEYLYNINKPIFQKNNFNQKYKALKVIVNESYEFEFENSDLEKLDLLKRSASKFHVIEKNKSYAVKFKKSDFNNREYVISVNANSYKVKISNEIDQL